jgi:hypothetical protein
MWVGIRGDDDVGSTGYGGEASGRVMMKNVTVLASAFVLFLALPCLGVDRQQPQPAAQSPSPASNFALSLEPYVNLPLMESQSFFTTGGSCLLSARYSLPELHLLSFSGELGYSLDPLNIDTALNAVSLGAGLGVDLSLTSWLTAHAFVTGGYSLDFLSLAGQTSLGGNAYLTAGLGAEFLLGSFGIGVQAAFRDYFGMYEGLGISLKTAYHFPVPQKSATPQGLPQQAGPLSGGVLKLRTPVFDSVFPVFRKYYDTHPIGTVVLENTGSKPVTDLKITLNVKQYMDDPKDCSAPEQVEAGGKAGVVLNALFTDKVLDITEATLASVEIILAYTYDGGVTPFR